MNTLQIWANYGVLAHERHPVFTADGPAVDASEALTVELPEGWTSFETVHGATLLESPDGGFWLASEILTGLGDNPALRFWDGVFFREVLLEVVGNE